METAKEVLDHLLSLSNKDKKKQAEYFGVKSNNILGITVPELRAKAKEIKTNHPLALKLWETNYHEARMLSTMIADPKKITLEEIDIWVKDFDSWDIVDGACYNLFRYSPHAEEIIQKYVSYEEEYIRRTPFALIAGLAVGIKNKKDEDFLKYFPIIEQYAFDERNFVWKAVNWALRQIGKRSLYLHPQALALSEKLSLSDNPTHRKIGKDAFRELSDPKTIARIKK
ncbi:MAG: DNA alkylation repair protein [Bacteroidales bacterium]|nr:DNA alkylation repair protein [Bacteroidales bacterium]MDD4684576.1 DNA alkylation repair protein [Bacteroidales bacterium]